MKTCELDYDLPEGLIAQQPAARRSDSRLLVMERRSGRVRHRRFAELTDFLQKGDCLVINESKVIPARFFARRASGGRIEGLFLKISDGGYWQVLLKNASRVRVGERLILTGSAQRQGNAEPITLAVIEKKEQGIWLVEPSGDENYLDILDRLGSTPLPPYIYRRCDANGEQIEREDRQRYQTVYARKGGSVAAPTAGLHFSEELLASLGGKSVNLARLTLHVGLGTFKPITSEKVEDHTIHIEQYELDQSNVDIINRTLAQRARVVAVGTTSVRTVETLADAGRVRAGTGWTDLFIKPGYQFEIVSGLLTNFHLPRTSLLALVCAFAGVEQVLDAYRQAVQEKYRFYSYGDAMLIL